MEDCQTLNANTSQIFSRSFIDSLQSAPSPDMFESDVEEDIVLNITSCSNGRSSNISESEPSPVKLSQEELITKSDKCLLSRLNKYLSGVPPPPKHTIFKKDCKDLLDDIYKNTSYFWGDGLRNELSQGISSSQKSSNVLTQSSVVWESYDQSNDSAYVDNEVVIETSDDAASMILSLDEQSKDSAILIENQSSFSMGNSTSSDFQKSRGLSQADINDEVLLRYRTVSSKEAASLSPNKALLQKSFGIHYNRSTDVEEFERLSLKLCDRYIGVETQSTCNIWTDNEMKVAKAQSLLVGKVSGQSPGKRLTYLTKRRRTFSSANLQTMKVPNKQLLLNVRKPVIRKGKSPRGKSPRGSAKKRALKCFTSEILSPRKLKLETSKRALFQSPPSNRAGPSTVPSANNEMSSVKIKRALFSTPKKGEESRKRKSEETLEGPKRKWTKSFSFDCPREGENISTCDRQSVGNVLPRSNSSTTCSTNKLSETHRKKLLWAVFEVLKTKGIGMQHPCFKEHAAALMSKVKKYMPDLQNKNIPKKPGSTSDRMLKLAKLHVHYIIEPKSALQ